MINEEKQKALEAALGQIEKQYGKGSVMKLGESGARRFLQDPLVWISHWE